MMTKAEGKVKAYDYVLKFQGVPFNDFAELLCKKYQETLDFWEIVKEELLTEKKIVIGGGYQKVTLEQPSVLLFTDTFKQN